MAVSVHLPDDSVVVVRAAVGATLLEALQGGGNAGETTEAVPGLWICKVCGVIYDPSNGDPDLGIAAGTPFEAIPDDWTCPICGTRKANFVPYRPAALQTA